MEESSPTFGGTLPPYQSYAPSSGKIQKIEDMYRGAKAQIKIVSEENQRLRINVHDLNEYIKEKEGTDAITLKDKEQTKKDTKLHQTIKQTITDTPPTDFSQHLQNHQQNYLMPSSKGLAALIPYPEGKR